MKIAVVQTQSVKGDIGKNSKHHEQFIKTAARYKANAIFFPELSLTGYEPELAKDVATTPDDNRLSVFQSLSNENNVTTGVGIPIINASGIQICMIIFQPGAPRQVYAKQFLHDDEKPYFVPGNEQLYITAGSTKIALAICYESLLPQHAEEVCKERADIYLASVAKSANGVSKAYRHYPETAAKYAMPVLMANCVGYCDNFQSTGSSAAWNKEGKLAGRLDENSEGLLIFDTETEQVTTVLQAGETPI